MANGAHPPSHALLKVKEDHRHPPPTPPNVSVEAIKRSLVHTPTPRRFKKLRLRRMQERMRGEVGKQEVPVVEDGLEWLGNKRRGQEGHDGGGDTGLQNDEHDELDELDLAILNIGLDDDYVQPDGPATRDQALSRSHEPRPQTPKRDPLVLSQSLCDHDDADSGGYKELVRKKRGRKGKTRKKHPRRLPVDDLVLGPERVASLSPSDDDVNPKELSQDPISQLSSDDARSRHRKTTAKKTVKTNIRNPFGDIDISKFCLPRTRSLLHEARYHQQSPTYADGFEGDEAFPIGRPMPTSQRNKLSSKLLRAKSLKRELTLVAEKEFGSEDQNVYAPHNLPREQCQLGKQASVLQNCRLAPSGCILIDPFIDDNGPRNDLDYEERRPEIQDDLSAISDIGTTRTISSPLVRKQSYTRRVRFNVYPDEQENMSQSSAVALSLVETRKPARHDNIIRKKSSDTALFSSQFTRKQKEELDVFQELAMVSVHKRFDSDESSEDDFSLDDEVHSDIYLNAEENEMYNDIHTYMSSGDEGDVEMEDHSNISQVEPEIQEAKSDSIIDDFEAPNRVYEDSQSSPELSPYSWWQEEKMDAWIPRRLRILNSAMEVDDGIVSSPESPRAMSRVPSNVHASRRHTSEVPSQALSLTKSPQEMAYNTQVSIELGDTQKLIWQSSQPFIPETQMDDEPIGAQDDTSQYTFVPENKYFSRASQLLEDSARSLIRKNSTTSRLGSYEVDDDSRDGWVSKSQTSNYTTKKQFKGINPTT